MFIDIQLFWGYKSGVHSLSHKEIPPNGNFRYHYQSRNSRNSRNSLSRKTIIADDGYVEIDIPRDRDGSFEPQFIGKHQRKIDSFSDEIIDFYGHGMSVHDMQSDKSYDLSLSKGVSFRFWE